MAGVSQRKRGGKYRIYYLDEHGVRKFATGHADKRKSEDLANRLEQHCRLIKEGLADPHERTQKAASVRPIADHIEDFRLNLLAKGDTARHATHFANTARRLLNAAGFGAVDKVQPDAIQGALGRMRAAGKSPRTCNHALSAVEAFLKFLFTNHRIREVPRGLAAIRPFNQKVDRVRVRRAATKEEIGRLLVAAEAGEDTYIYGPTKSKLHKIAVTGPNRAALYRLALATGFRANELRSLRPECFFLEGDEPCVVLNPEDEKNRKGTRQPITREFAAWFAKFLEGKTFGRPALVVPTRTAQMLRVDLEAAGIPYQTDKGHLDMHSMRHTFISHLAMSGINLKIVQTLARHSSIVLTMSIYAHAEDDDVRKALESGRETPKSVEMNTPDAYNGTGGDKD